MRIADPTWANEIERQLEFVASGGYLVGLLPRLRAGCKPFWNTFAEIQAAYFLGKLQKLPILAWEQPGSGGRTGDLLFQLPDGRALFTEVKNPGWEAEIVKTEGPHTPRLKRPKYYDGSGGGTAPWVAVRHAITKAYGKLPNNQPTMLILVPDLFVPVTSHTMQLALEAPLAGAASYGGEAGYFLTAAHENLGAVAVLEPTMVKTSPEYRLDLYRNPRALTQVAVPTLPHEATRG